MSCACHLDRKTEEEEGEEEADADAEEEQSAAVCQLGPCVLAHFRHISQCR